MNTEPKNAIEIGEPAISLKTLLFIFLGIIAVTFLAAVVMPSWMPGLTASLIGSSPKVYWFLSRGSAMVAYMLLWLSMALGLIITNQMAKVWPGGPASFDLHEYASLLGLAFSLFHGLILIGDQYMHFSVFQVLVPFATQNYRPAWVGIGQISFYLWMVVSLTFYVRKRIGNHLWRLIHYASFLIYLTALAHGILSGTDSGSVWAAILYWSSGASLLFLFVYRVIVSIHNKQAKARKLTSTLPAASNNKILKSGL